jgi:proteic killer suppression protein
MEVRFRTPKLRKQFEKGKEAIRAYGEEVGRRYVQRINLIKSTRDMDTLKKLPGLRCHELKGDCMGQWAVNLNGFYRLIFILEGQSPEIICIEKVSKHYGD